MALLKLMVLNSYNEEIFSSQNKTEVTMAYRGYYQPGDKISIVTDTKGLYLKLRLDDSLDESWVYLTDYQYILQFLLPRSVSLMGLVHLVKNVILHMQVLLVKQNL